MNPEQSRAQGSRKPLANEISKVVNKMDGSPFLLDVVLNKSFYTDALMDSGCLCYSAFNLSFVKRHKLPRIPIKPRELKLAKKDSQQQSIKELTFVDVDIDGRHEKIWGYVIDKLAYNMILGNPWMKANAVVYDALQRSIRFGPPVGLRVKGKG